MDSSDRCPVMVEEVKHTSDRSPRRTRKDSFRTTMVSLAARSCIVVLFLSASGANGEVVDPVGGVGVGPRAGWLGSESPPHHHIESIKLYGAVAEALTLVGSPGCRNSSRALITDLGNFTLWAVQMFDATAKFPGGYVSGNYYRMGDFDECLGVRVDLGGKKVEEGSERVASGQHQHQVVQGQYCLARLHLEEKEKARQRRLRQQAPGTPAFDPYALSYSPKSSAWETIEFKGDRSKHRKDYVHWAFCIPSLCTANEFEKALKIVIPKMGDELGMNIDISVDPSLCQVQKPKPWNMLDYAFCGLVGAMILLSSSATFLDIYFGPSPENIRKDKGFMANLLLCFSIKNNLVHLPRKRENVGGLNVMFGIRFISTASVIVSHKFIHVLLGPLQNSNYVEENNRNPLHACFLHGDLVVDTFFTSGAFLLVYFLMKELERKKLGVFIIYIFRYMRLTPVFMFLLFFYATLLNKIGSGPLWEKITSPEKERCLENWWTNMIYMNNYINPERMCMSHSWYLPCDTHMFILSVPLILLLKSRPRIGIILLSIGAILSALIPAIITLTWGLDATLLVYLDSFILNAQGNNDLLLKMYYPTHTRAGPYIVGLIAGYIHYELKMNERKVSRMVSIPLFLGGCLMLIGPLFYAALFYVPGRPYYPLEAALYAGTHRMVWGCGIAIIIISLSSGNLSWINFILSNQLFIALGKLTYSAYLVHLPFDLIAVGMIRQSFYLSTFNMISISITDMVYAHAAAILLYLMIECPFRDMAALVFSKRNVK